MTRKTPDSPASMYSPFAPYTPIERISTPTQTGQLSSTLRARRYCAISDNTVRHHLTSVFAKLGVSDRLSLVVYAYRHKLI